MVPNRPPTCVQQHYKRPHASVPTPWSVFFAAGRPQDELRVLISPFDSGLGLFYDEDMELTPLEQEYRTRLLALFSRVDAKHPDRGVTALILRARQDAMARQIPLETALAEMYQGAEARTERRIRLLTQCALRQDAME